MVLIRLLTLICMINNVKLTAKHIAGKLNKFSDLLSRLKYRQFRLLAKQEGLKFNGIATPIPVELWPMSKIWLKESTKTTKNRKKHRK